MKITILQGVRREGQTLKRAGKRNNSNVSASTERDSTSVSTSEYSFTLSTATISVSSLLDIRTNQFRVCVIYTKNTETIEKWI